MRKIALFSGVASALLFASPVLAQDAPQTQSTEPAQADGQASAAQQASGAVSVTPGMTVKGADGDLGKLVNVQTNAEGKQELTVQGADGQVKAVPLAGFKIENGAIRVAQTLAEFQASMAVAPSAAAAPAQPDMSGDGGEVEADPNAPAASSPAPSSSPPTQSDGATEDPQDETDAEPTAPARPQA